MVLPCGPGCSKTHPAPSQMMKVPGALSYRLLLVQCPEPLEIPVDGQTLLLAEGEQGTLLGDALERSHEQNNQNIGFVVGHSMLAVANMLQS